MRTDMFKSALDAYSKDAEGALAERLRFVEGLVQIQSEIAATDRRYAPPDVETAREALLTGQPVFLSAPPNVPRTEFLAAVERIASYVADHAGLDGVQSAALRDADFPSSISEGSLSRVAESIDAFVSHVAEAVGAGADAALKPPTVAYVLTSALVPFFADCAETVVESLGGLGTEPWTLGTCPVCGSPATMGIMSEHTAQKGAMRTLWCGLCHTEWAYDRLRCVRCGSHAIEKLRYVYLDGDPAHRLHLCDECSGYVRVVFEGDLDKPLSLVVEDAVSVALDAVAVDQGYSATVGMSSTGQGAE